MSLMKCPNCGKEIEFTTVSQCPECGFNISNNTNSQKNNDSNNKRKKIGKSIFTIILVIFVFLLFAFCGCCGGLALMGSGDNNTNYSQSQGSNDNVEQTNQSQNIDNETVEIDNNSVIETVTHENTNNDETTNDDISTNGDSFSGESITEDKETKIGNDEISAPKEKAYNEYFDYLYDNNKLKITNYGSDEKSISFFDCYGDDYPEMIYFYPIKEGDYDVYYLYIASFDGKKIKEITSDVVIDPGAPGSPSIRLFTIDDSKTIYGIEQYCVGFECVYYDFFTLEEGKKGKLQRKDLYTYLEIEDYDSGNTQSEYMKEGASLTKDAFESEIKNLINDVNIFFQSSYYSYWGDPYQIEGRISDESEVLTYNEALSFLQQNADIDLSDRKIKVGDTIVLGVFEQDNDETNGKEPIEWEIISVDKNKALLLSKYSLENVSYNLGQYSEDITWETCGVREWLNDYFYNQAFSDEEKNQIVSVTLDNINHTKWPLPEPQTTDKVFLLSYDEIQDIFGLTWYNPTNNFGYNQKLICSPTPYAMRYHDYRIGIDEFTYYNKCLWDPVTDDLSGLSYEDIGYSKDVIGSNGAAWLLRSMTARDCACEVTSGGSTGMRCMLGIAVDMCYIRPAIYIEYNK